VQARSPRQRPTIDLRHELSDRARELKLFWVWNSLLEYIRSRGSSGRLQPPLSVVIDELSFFVRGTALNTKVICEEFREVIQVRQRNANIWLTAATQEQAELPETMQRACTQLASQLYGATSELQTAQANARRWYPADPYRVKHWRDVWGRVTVGQGRYGSSMTGVLGQEPVFLPLEEQEHLASLRFRTLPKGSWLLAASAGEGRPPTTLTRVSTAALDPGLYVQAKLVARLRRHLMQRDGLPVAAATGQSLPQRTKTPGGSGNRCAGRLSPGALRGQEPRSLTRLPRGSHGIIIRPLQNRLMRSSARPAIRLTQTDTEILQVVNRLHYVTAGQLGRLLYVGGERSSQRRLKGLCDGGYLLRLRALPVPRYGSAPHVFSLANRGRRVLAALGIELTSPYMRPSEEQAAADNSFFMAHTLAAVDVLVAALALCRDGQVSWRLSEIS
jgi:Replication-relaxation